MLSCNVLFVCCILSNTRAKIGGEVLGRLRKESTTAKTSVEE